MAIDSQCSGKACPPAFQNDRIIPRIPGVDRQRLSGIGKGKALCLWGDHFGLPPAIIAQRDGLTRGTEIQAHVGRGDILGDGLDIGIVNNESIEGHLTAAGVVGLVTHLIEVAPFNF